MSIKAFGNDRETEYKGVYLYHGSYMEVRNPEIRSARNTKDFGMGFYLTTMRQQAVRFTRKFRGEKKVINIYEFDRSVLEKLDFKVFSETSDEWLDFIANCRLSNKFKHGHDAVEGPLADDQVWDHVSDYLEGEITREIFWDVCNFNIPTHQICLNTEEALKSIKFVESCEVK